jgi:hypothetical protein
LSLTILHSVLTTDYTVANNFESNDYYTINWEWWVKKYCTQF